jgi:hypothetical protein
MWRIDRLLHDWRTPPFNWSVSQGGGPLVDRPRLEDSAASRGGREGASSNVVSVGPLAQVRVFARCGLTLSIYRKVAQFQGMASALDERGSMSLPIASARLA